MPAIRSFAYTFTVGAPLAVVAAFHRDTRALPRLIPPPVFVQLHRSDPLAEGAVAEFSLWFGPVPVRWRAVHSDVDALRGFTDVQAAGPLQWWKHTHRFEAIDAGTTRVSEHIEYAHHPGWRGVLSRILYSPLSLRLLFAYRRFATRRALRPGSHL